MTDDVLETYEAAENTGLDPEIVDVPLEELEDDLRTGSSSVPDLDSMGPKEFLESVSKRGSVIFDDGRMLTVCPCSSSPAICGMYPLPHPETGDKIMVCTGPVVKKDRVIKFFSEDEIRYTSDRASSSCPYHPDRINEPPSYKQDSDSGDNWI
jgi:hypothetical protein